EGCAMFATAVAEQKGWKAERLKGGNEAEKELGMFRAQAIHFASCANQAEFIMARDRGDRDAMRRLAADEMALAQELLPLVLADSRIGYESSNQYFYTPYDLVEKIINCRQIL
ncbi:MAG: hypothetical protein FWF84_01965, partial [Kiritimatiellaeota bacterium]|nr:hypothetical protein [Kiritimatiellota bacterium]